MALTSLIIYYQIFFISSIQHLHQHPSPTSWSTSSSTSCASPGEWDLGEDLGWRSCSRDHQDLVMWLVKDVGEGFWWKCWQGWCQHILGGVWEMLTSANGVGSQFIYTHVFLISKYMLRMLFSIIIKSWKLYKNNLELSIFIFR